MVPLHRAILGKAKFQMSFKEQILGLAIFYFTLLAFRPLVTRRALLLLLPLLNCACSSTHDLKRDGPNYLGGGGGFIDDEMAPGVYRIKGFSNLALFATPDSAAKTFRYRAEKLCPAGYDEIRSSLNSYRSSSGGVTIVPDPKNPIPVELPPPVITSKIGFVRCNDSPLSFREAQMLVTADDEP